MAKVLQTSSQFVATVGEASLAYNVSLYSLLAIYIKLLPTRGTQYRLRND